MSEESDRRARLRDRIEREAAGQAGRTTPVPGRTTLVEQLHATRSPAATGVPGKATLVDAHDGADVERLIAQGHAAVVGAGSREHAYHALVDALAAHGTSIGSERAGEMMALCIDLLVKKDAAPQPVQRKSSGTGPSEAPVAVAERGVDGAGAPLPHIDRIQRAFGRHDVSHVRTATGGAAAESSRALGASAYAIGDRVGFASSPDLHTAAHEAAHVIQQQGGVHLKGGLDGGANDPHEQHADAVADAVVRGESAEALLDAGRGTAPVVQRKEGDAPLAHNKQTTRVDIRTAQAEDAGQNIAAPEYIHHHIAQLRRDVDVFLCSRDISSGVPEVHFVPDIGPFLDALFVGFDQEDNSAKLTRLRNWVAPLDLYDIVDRNRPLFETGTKRAEWKGDPNEALAYGAGPKGPPRYFAAVAVGIGSVLEERLVASLKRMSQQLVAVTAKHRAAGKDTPVVARELVPAHPLDWEVALSMVGRGEPTVQVAQGALHADAAAQPKYRKITRVEWQGSNGGPWNAVRVEPADAGPESVAAEVLGKSTEAYRIKRVGPYFLIPEDQAARIVGLPSWMAPAKQDAIQSLAYGKHAADVEKAEVERGLPADAKAPTGTELDAQWHAIQDQLLGISSVVRPYRLDAELGPALSHHAGHYADLSTLSGHDAAVRGRLFAKQTNLLERVGAQVAALTAHAPVAMPGPSLIPMLDVLAKLMRIANLSHLPETGDAAMNEIVTVQRTAVTDVLEAKLGDIATQIEIARLSGAQSRQAQHRSQGAYGATLAERAEKLRGRVAVLRGQMLADKAALNELEALQHDVDALRFEAGIIAEVGQLGQLFEVLDQLEDNNWVLFSEGLTAKIGETSDDNRIGRLETARRGSMDLRRELNIIHGEWLKIEATAQSLETSLAKGGAKDATAQARAFVQPQIIAIQAKLKKVGSEEAVQTFLKDAFDKVDSAKTRAMIVQIATMIGVAALASATGGLAGGIAEGLGAGAMGVSMASLAAETAMFTAVNARLNGEPMLAAFVNNGIGNLLTFGAMKGVGKAFEASETFGWALKGAKSGAAVRTAALIAARGSQMTVEMIVATGIQIAQAEYESVRATGHTMSAHELEMTAAQGMAMIIGTAITHRVLGDPALVTHTLGNELGARLAKLRGMSDAVAAHGDSAQAIALMEQTRKLIEDVGNRAKELTGKNDHELAALGYTRAQVEALAKFAGAQSKALASMDAGAFAAQLGLHSVVPGRVFSGAQREVDAVVNDFRSRGYAAEKTAEGYRITKKDEAPIELFVRADAAAPSAEQATPKSPQDSHVAQSATEPTPAVSGTTRRHAPSISGLDGRTIAAQVPGTTYEPDGSFSLAGKNGTMRVTVRRTTGAARVSSDGQALFIDIPRGLKGTALERAVVEQLGAAHELLDKGRASIHSEKGIAAGRTTFDDFAQGRVTAESKARAHKDGLADNASSLSEHARRIATGTARSESEMLASIAQGDTPRYLARVDAEANFLQYKTFGRFNREFIYATEPADLRGLPPAIALEKVGWTKSWMQKFVNQEIAICVFDTQAPIRTPTGARTTSVGKMAWETLISKALNDPEFVDLAIASAGVADKAELAKILAILERTPVRAQPATRDPSLAVKATAVAAILERKFSANDLFTGIGSTMNTSGELGAREVMVENNGTEFRLTPENHVLVRIGKLAQEDVDALQ
jgi:hypothetical protein